MLVPQAQVNQQVQQWPQTARMPAALSHAGCANGFPNPISA